MGSAPKTIQGEPPPSIRTSPHGTQPPPSFPPPHKTPTSWAQEVPAVAGDAPGTPTRAMSPPLGTISGAPPRPATMQGGGPARSPGSEQVCRVGSSPALPSGSHMVPRPPCAVAGPKQDPPPPLPIASGLGGGGTGDARLEVKRRGKEARKLGSLPFFPSELRSGNKGKGKLRRCFLSFFSFFFPKKKIRTNHFSCSAGARSSQPPSRSSRGRAGCRGPLTKASPLPGC